MTSPFGFLIPPAAPLTPPVQTISPNQLAYTIPSSAIKSHLAVFLLPGQTLPEGAAAALYIQFPGQDFKLLGALGEGKESAIFRVAGLKTGGANVPTGSTVPEVDMDADEPQQTETVGDVTVGISLEPAQDVQAKLEALKAQQSTTAQEPTSALALRPNVGSQSGNQQPSTKVLAKRIIQNAFNFLASFEGGNGMVPIKAFEGWWQKFERRVDNDPGFLEREQD